MDTIVSKTRKAVAEPPCQMTVIELKEEVTQAVEDVRNGFGFSQEEVFNEIEKLLIE